MIVVENSERVGRRFGDRSAARLVVAELIAVVSPQGRAADAQRVRDVLAADPLADGLSDEPARLFVAALPCCAQLYKRSRLHNLVDSHERAWLTEIRPKSRAYARELDHAPNRLADFSIDLQPSRVLGCVGAGEDQLSQAAAVDKLEPGEIDSDDISLVAQSLKSVRERLRYRQVKLSA